MANLHLVTGYAGQAHITAEDHGSLNAALTNGGNYVLNRGNKFAASAITSNQVRVLDGDLLLQGRHVRLAENAYVDLTIDSGAQGMYRNDLIVARYTKNSSTGVEECNLVVIKGTAVASDPADPAYTEGDLLVDHDAQVDFPLYRVSLNGLSVSLAQLFEVITFVTVGADGKIKSDYLPAMNYIPTSQKGAASGVAPLTADKKIDAAYLPLSNSVSANNADTAATSAAVKTAYDLASGVAYPYGGLGEASVYGSSGVSSITLKSQYNMRRGFIGMVNLSLHVNAPGAKEFSFLLAGLPNAFANCIIAAPIHFGTNVSGNVIVDSVSGGGFQVAVKLDEALNSDTHAQTIKFMYVIDIGQ